MNDLPTKKTIQVDFDENSLQAEIDKLTQERLSKTITIEYDPNEAGLRAAKARLDAELNSQKQIKLTTNLDETSLREKLAIVDAELAVYDAKSVKPKIKPELSKPSEAVADVELAWLSRDRVVKLLASVKEDSVNAAVLTFAKLTGLRAVTNYTKEFAETIGTLDAYLPVVAAVTTGIGDLSAGLFDLSSNILGLAGNIAQIGGIGLMAPALLGGLLDTAVVGKLVFTDFAKALGGSKTAMAALPPAGQEAVKSLQPVIASLRQSVSAEFWDTAGAGMKRFTEQALPAFTAGYTGLAKNFATLINGILDEEDALAKNGSVTTFMSLFGQGMANSSKGVQLLLNALNSLSIAGASFFPAMGSWFTGLMTKFDAWSTKIASDGSFNKWVQNATYQLGQVFNVAGGVIDVFNTLVKAAQQAGAIDLHGLADGIHGLNAALASSGAQDAMVTLFSSAKTAVGNIIGALRAAGPEFANFAKTIGNTMVQASQATSEAIKIITNLLGSSGLQQGLNSLMTGVKSMFTSLEPAVIPVEGALADIGGLLGQVAIDAGPLFADLFTNLAGAFHALVTAIEPILPPLIEVGRQIVDTLGPALTQLFTTLVPELGSLLLHVGPVVESIVKWVTQASTLTGLQAGFHSAIEEINSFLDAAKNLGDGLSKIKLFQPTQADQQNAQAGWKQVAGALLDGLRSGDPQIDQWINDLQGKLGNAASDVTSKARDITDAVALTMKTQQQSQSWTNSPGFDPLLNPGWGSGNTQVAQDAAAAAAGMKLASDAAAVLRDTSRDASSQLDAMDKALQALRTGANPQTTQEAKAAAAETVNSMLDQVKSLQPDIKALGAQVFGPDGLLNVGSGSAAVLTLFDSVDQVANKTKVSAKQAYNDSMNQNHDIGKAWAAAQAEVAKGYSGVQQAAQDAGLQTDSLKGQWESLVGQPWQVFATITGTDDKFRAVMDEAQSLGLAFNGQNFEAWLLANPDEAMKATSDAAGVAQDYVNAQWQATIKATPKPAQDALQGLLGMTDAEWNRGDFTAVMKAAQNVPGLPGVLSQILNVQNGDYTAVVKAIADAAAAEIAINEVARNRVATISIQYVDPGNPNFGSAPGNTSGPMHVSANGNIFQGNFKTFADGGFENHVAQIARPGVMPRVWAEAETEGEAYIPYAMSKRSRSAQILERVASDFGFGLIKKYANGGAPGPTATGDTYQAPVHIGQLITNNPDEAVKKLQRHRSNALALKGIRGRF